MKHTPGLFDVLKVSESEWQVVAKSQTEKYSETPVAIARVQSWDNEPPADQVEGNARLFAAAPELLEMVIHARAALKCYCESDTPIIKDMEALIAKAEGAGRE